MYDLFSSLKCKHCTYQSNIIFAPSALVFTRRTDLSLFQRSHWSTIHILLLPNLAFDAPFRCFLSESVNILFGPRFELDSDMFLLLTSISIRMRSGQVQQQS
jgi:hypothetical protein